MAAKNSTPENTTNCRRCGRTLRSTASVRRGYGAGCWTKVRAARATATDYKAHQITSATEAIEDGAVIPTRGNIHLVVSSNGADVHRTTHNHCSCPAGLKARTCWHTLAVRMLVGAPTVTLVRPAHALAA